MHDPQGPEAGFRFLSPRRKDARSSQRVLLCVLAALREARLVHVASEGRGSSCGGSLHAIDLVWLGADDYRLQHGGEEKVAL